MRTHWKLKAHALATLSRAPGGWRLYRWATNSRAARSPDVDEMLTRGLDVLGMIDEVGASVDGRDCLEVGTGWCPWVPLLLVLKGARTVLTIDVNEYLTLGSAIATTRRLIARADRAAAATARSTDDIRARLAPALESRSLAEWLSATGIDYVVADIATLARPSATVDFVLSSNVLEHVPPDGLRAIHRESVRLLRPNGLAVHRFNPEDHFRQFDRSITGANFLQFSEQEWYWLGGSGLGYHNRLRCPEHRRLMVDAGLEIVWERTREDVAAREAIETGRLPVHEAFRHMSPKDLSDDYMWIVASKPARGAR